jgi:hypothetical protein
VGRERLGYSVATAHHSTLFLSLIWIAHIGLDRMLGFGLKYPTRLNDAHLDPEHHVVRSAFARDRLQIYPHAREKMKLRSGVDGIIVLFA